MEDGVLTLETLQDAFERVKQGYPEPDSFLVLHPEEHKVVTRFFRVNTIYEQLVQDESKLSIWSAGWDARHKRPSSRQRCWTEWTRWCWKEANKRIYECTTNTNATDAVEDGSKPET